MIDAAGGADVVAAALAAMSGSNEAAHFGGTDEVECVEEMDCFVGGDGGSAICGDRPEPEMWVSFASSYRYPGDDIDEYAFPEFLDGASLRRVLPLDL